MDGHSDTSEEATSAQGTKSTADLESEDRHPRDGPRDKPTEPCVEDPRGSINLRRKFRPHQRWRTYALGRKQVESTPQLDS
ncbi:hypothetical protein B296_00057786 [Ensete ventricosum]|uniref:Uncharacterized protein n=1 Tax=Ensete ventricosum TaxID=4639 RepID=A0A426XLE3_ENSVE|nr:hypothetical protein B296_00057786 [Ensete ventricosum]